MGLLELVGVSKGYDQGGQEVAVLDDVDLTVDSGEFVAMVGPSGSGKSTLLHLAGGLDRPDRGRVVLDGEDLGELSVGARARLRRQHIGFIFQFFHLVPGLTVAENVELPLLLDRRRDRAGTIPALLDRLGLGHRADHQPGQLSGGEMQRTAIARALVAEPLLVLADEPTGNLDSVAGATILDLLTESVREAGCALLLVTHDAGAAARADRVVHLRDGRLETTPAPRERRRTLRAGV